MTTLETARFDWRKALLVCGVLSSLLYVGADVLAVLRYPDYH
jgi:hypothetical protein